MNYFKENEIESTKGVENTYKEPKVTINYMPKEQQKEIPEGAEIYDRSVTINIREIEGGYLTEKTTWTMYEMKEEKMSCMHSTCSFSSTKPNPSLLEAYNLA